MAPPSPSILLLLVNVELSIFNVPWNIFNRSAYSSAACVGRTNIVIKRAIVDCKDLSVTIDWTCIYAGSSIRIESQIPVSEFNTVYSCGHIRGYSVIVDSENPVLACSRHINNGIGRTITINSDILVVLPKKIVLYGTTGRERTSG